MLLYCCTVSGKAHCDISCEKLDLVPSPLAYNGTDLPMISLFCNITGGCQLDFISVLYNWTSKIRTPYEYVINDVFLKCSDNKEEFGKFSNNNTKS